MKEVNQMTKYREILLLKSLGISEREIATSCSVSRNGSKSTIIASQLEPVEWHNNFGASQLADSILDRIVSHAYKIILSGDSLRPKQLED